MVLQTTLCHFYRKFVSAVGIGFCRRFRLIISSQSLFHLNFSIEIGINENPEDLNEENTVTAGGFTFSNL